MCRGSGLFRLWENLNVGMEGVAREGEPFKGRIKSLEDLWGEKVLKGLVNSCVSYLVGIP